MTALVTTQAAAQFAPPNTSAVPQSPPSGTSPTPGSTSLIMPSQTQAGSPTNAAREALAKAKKGIADNQAGVAVQAYAQAAVLAMRAPEVATEVQQVKDQLLQRGITAAQLEAVIKQTQATMQPNAMVAPNLLQSPPSGTTAPQSSSAMMQAPAVNPNALANAPYNPLRDKAAALSAQAKLALARGDLMTARQLINQASELKVPDDAFVAGQLKPWQVQIDVERAERSTAAGLVATPSAQGVQQASVQQASGTGADGSSVQSGVFQPAMDKTQVAPASSNSTRPVLDLSGLPMILANLRTSSIVKAWLH